MSTVIERMWYATLNAMGVDSPEQPEGQTKTPAIESPKADAAKSVTGTLIRFTSADDTDVDGEYFDDGTDLGFESEKIVPILYHHAQHPEIGSLPIGHATLVKSAHGIVIDPARSALWDDDEFNEDEFIKQVLGDSADYMAMLERMGWDRVKSVAGAVWKALQMDGALGWSSGAIESTVKRNGNHIVAWHPKEATITPRQAEPRNLVETIKSITADLSAEDKQMTDDEKTTVVDDTTAVTPDAVETQTTHVPGDDTLKAADFKAAMETLRGDILAIKAATDALKVENEGLRQIVDGLQSDTVKYTPMTAYKSVFDDVTDESTKSADVADEAIKAAATAKPVEAQQVKTTPLHLTAIRSKKQ